MNIILETVNLSKNFGALQAVRKINLKVKEGSLHSIIGPNGAGKTTLFNLLTGFLKPSEGRILFRQRDITCYRPDQISKMGIGRSFQVPNIFPELTVLENVRIAVQSRTQLNYRPLTSLKKHDYLEKKAMELLEIVNISDKMQLRAKHLSHGEKKILDIAIALATNPRVLLLDEPTAGLVGDEIRRIVDLITQLSRCITVVLVEHNIDVVLSISDTISVLYYGAIIAEGSPYEIQTNREVQEIYLGGYQC